MESVVPPFLCRWRALPDELKLTILEYVVFNGSNLNEEDFNGTLGSRSPSPSRHERFYLEILPCLTVPEISGIALQILYLQNLIEMDGPIQGQNMSFPPRHVHKYIRECNIFAGHDRAHSHDLLRVMGTLHFRTKILQVEYHSAELYVDSTHQVRRLDDLEGPVLTTMSIAEPEENVKMRYERINSQRTGISETVDAWPELEDRNAWERKTIRYVRTG
ncbi:hypothetical protein CC86DRAFT_407875 [Ophiobolus disseminans]|uniref:Uncharacterized protein n=1 Tax=Ophiobolus disseminans TaxID=1469910 RepID=A0A6A6ZWG4_9PLEO|nr:hypothetical protein CC86DRAFT_407875 [Ophiobolus disseminans]